ADWPATFIFKNPVDGGLCTSTAIGPRVILTAAHCIPDGAQGEIEADSKDINVTCNRHPRYPENAAADFSLCLAADALAKPEGGFEKISNDKTLIAIGDKLLLLGYGCIAANEQERTFGVLYQGEASVEALPSEQKAFIRTKGGAAVCFGDSGGGVFRYLDEGKT